MVVTVQGTVGTSRRATPIRGGHLTASLYIYIFPYRSLVNIFTINIYLSSLYYIVVTTFYTTCRFPVPDDAQGQLQVCRRFSHRTAVINNRIYIDGGFVNLYPLDLYPANYTSKIVICPSVVGKH
jgi:hypothetical protein